tara:strand:- start:928 stop:1146 length:219 start_codon:yes stop_codon:yes gene_type:complete
MSGKKKKKKNTGKKSQSIYDMIFDDESDPIHKGTGMKAITPTPEHKIELFKMFGDVQTAGYKTRKSKANLKG